MSLMMFVFRLGMDGMTSFIAATRVQPQAAGLTIYRRFMRLCALALITALAACQSVVPRGGQAPVGPPTVTGPTEAEIVAYGPKHRVALLLPLSGPDADVGQAIANATELALIDTKSDNISVSRYDTSLGVEAATRRAMADGNKLILGPLRGDNVLEVSNLAGPKGIPIISFSNDVGISGRNVFLLGHLPNQSIDRIVRYAKTQGLTRFGGLVPKSVYGQRALSNLTRSVIDAGGTLVGIQETDGTQASIDEATRKLAAAGAVDAILIADGGRAAIASIPSLKRHGLGAAKIMGTDLWNVDGSLSGNKTMAGAWFASVSDTFYNQYANKYRARYGKAPLRISSLGYDSILLVARVARQWPLATNFPISRLTDSGGFLGIDGAFRFLPSGLSERALEVQEVQAGKYVTIDPAPKAFAP
jgi:branched-chain amino acid transport system substrate-binding protein